MRTGKLSRTGKRSKERLMEKLKHEERRASKKTRGEMIHTT